jgi:carboxyl-terminal processing protease
MHWKQFLTVPLLISANLCGSGGLYGQETKPTEVPIAPRSKANFVSPVEVYDKVWNLIKDDYYESTYNGQNWARWQHRYDDKIKTQADAHLAICTMLASLGDRYTRYLDPEAFDEEKDQIKAKLCGIGVQIGIDKNKRVIVVAPIEDTPAFRAGILAADEISAIDGHSTKGFGVDDAAKLIRGLANTKVALTLVRDKKTLTIPVTRAEFHLKAVQTAKMLDSDVGYIRLSSFISEKATEEVKDALTKLASARGIIFDLRDNPGGLLTNAIDVSSMFLDRGNIVSTVDRDGYKIPTAADCKPVSHQPMVILINKGSASASEITSGALHDNGRAILVGSSTFGKGLVQSINKLDPKGADSDANGGVNITIARYLTPADLDINKKGIGPDVKVEVTEKDIKEHKGPWWEDPDGPVAKRSPEDFKDLQLKTALQVLKKKIDGEQMPVAMRTQAYKP